MTLNIEKFLAPISLSFVQEVPVRSPNTMVTIAVSTRSCLTLIVSLDQVQALVETLDATAFQSDYALQRE